MKVSVVMATYNGARYLPEQLDSLARQTRLPDELVVSDDHSTDNTWEILSAFSQDAPFPVRLRENGGQKGYVDNFLSALAEAQGDLLFLSDQDDVWLKDKISVITQSMEEADASLAVHTARVVDQDLNPLGTLLPRITRSAALPPGNPLDGPLKSFPLGFCLAFRREVAALVLPRLQAYPEAFRFYFGHEIPLYWVGKALGPTLYVADPLALYRRHGANASQGLEPPAAREALRQGADAYDKFAHHQMARADFATWLQEQSGSTPLPSVEAFLATIAATSSTRAEHLKSRASFYREPHRLRRATRLLALLANKGYDSRGRGGLGFMSLVKDVTHIFRRTHTP